MDKFLKDILHDLLFYLNLFIFIFLIKNIEFPKTLLYPCLKRVEELLFFRKNYPTSIQLINHIVYLHVSSKTLPSLRVILLLRVVFALQIFLSLEELVVFGDDVGG